MFKSREGKSVSQVKFPIRVDGNADFSTGMDMLEMPFYRLAIEEGLRTALLELNQYLHLGFEGVHDCMVCGPGT
jgi:hypothetical protein